MLPLIQGSKFAEILRLSCKPVARLSTTAQIMCTKMEPKSSKRLLHFKLTFVRNAILKFSFHFRSTESQYFLFFFFFCQIGNSRFNEECLPLVSDCLIALLCYTLRLLKSVIIFYTMLCISRNSFKLLN